MTNMHQFGKFLFQTANVGDELSDAELDVLKEELETLLEKHGVELSEYSFLGLPHEHYPMYKCISCGYLTLDIETCREGLALEDEEFHELERIIHQGRNIDGKFECAECQK